METTDHSTHEEPECKKAKMTHNEDKDVPTLSKQETGIDVNQENGQVPLLDTGVNKDVSVALDHESNSLEVRSLAIEDGKDVSFLSVEENVKEASVSELGAVDVAIECEERGGICVVLDNANSKDLSALESGDVLLEKVHVLELEEDKKVASVVPAGVNGNETPMTESVEQKDSCVAACGIKEDNDDLCSSIKDSSASFTGKKLLVLDLNGLLADIVSSPPKDHVSDINIGRRAIFKRPFCDDFLKFCFEKFEVGIWSSRTQRNVERITDYLLGDLKSRLLFCWDVSQCAKSTVGSLENKYKYVVFKELKRLWEKQDPDLPWKKGDYNETNTVLLDDSPYKALLNPPHTAIFPRSYDYHNKADTSLGEGGDLRLYLEKLSEAENIQEFIKDHPFGQEPITKASESWEFYNQIMGNLHW